ncbi:hypothetical protein GCM10009534_34910 [Kribbella sandramycini]
MVRGDKVRIWSRNGNDLTSRFPDVARALRAQVRVGRTADAEGTRPPGGILEGPVPAPSSTAHPTATAPQTLAPSLQIANGMQTRAPTVGSSSAYDGRLTRVSYPRRNTPQYDSARHQIDLSNN